jgi:hypothetical protein
VKVDEKLREKLISMVMSPLRLNFGMTQPLCNMQLGSPYQLVEVEFRVVVEHISTRDLAQEYLANITFPTSSGWGMSKKKEEGKKYELVWLPYRFKFQKRFSKPYTEWLELIETMRNEILGNYTKKEDQLMTAAFGTHEKWRLKDLAPKKWKLVRTVVAEMKVQDERGNIAGPSPSCSVNFLEILKVMIEPFPFAMLSPLGSDLTSLLQSNEKGVEQRLEGNGTASATGEMSGVWRSGEWWTWCKPSKRPHPRLWRKKIMCLLMRLTFVSWQSLLLSKALKFEQEAEDQKNELVVSNLEKRVKEFEDSLEEKDLKVKMLKQTWPKLNFVSWIKLLASVIRIKSLK